MKLNNISIHSIIIVIVSLFCFQTAQSQIKVNSNGNVGIGVTDPSYQLHSKGRTFLDVDANYCDGILATTYYVSGPGDLVTFRPTANNKGSLGSPDKFWLHLRCNNVIYEDLIENTSDKRVKTNITTIPSALNKLQQLRGINFDYKKDFFNTRFGSQANYDKEGKNKLGLLAQEVEKVFPQLVNKKDSIWKLNMIDLIPVLVEAIKEQQTEIETLQQQVNNQKSTESTTLKSATLTESEEESSQQDAHLSQNRPNPFTERTIIEYTLPETVQQATLYIYDMQGNQEKSYALTERANGDLAIAGSTLQPGMYMYTLIADGQEVDTKKMILTK
jgi:hypothetical protein